MHNRVYYIKKVSTKIGNYGYCLNKQSDDRQVSRCLKIQLFCVGPKILKIKCGIDKKFTMTLPYQLGGEGRGGTGQHLKALMTTLWID
jgi:hypothetical protein